MVKGQVILPTEQEKGENGSRAAAPQAEIFRCRPLLGSVPSTVSCNYDKLAPQAHGTLLLLFRHAACFLFLRHLTN